MNDVKFYYYFTGETVDGEFVDADPDRAMTKREAKKYARQILKDLDGGHLDAFYSETDQFAFDVEV